MATDLCVRSSNRIGAKVPVVESLRPHGLEYLELCLNPSLVRATCTKPRRQRSVRHPGGHECARAELWCPDFVAETAVRISCAARVPFREEAGLEIVRTAGHRREPVA